jgi:SulP family sulfate permease
MGWVTAAARRVARRAGGYLAADLRLDLLAGATVALVGIPQAMAYATILGVNPVYGLYAVILPAGLAALLRRSPYVVTGPTNATALAAAGILAAFSDEPGYLELVFALAVLSGAVQLLLGALRLGGLMRFVSNSVLTGFLAGAGTLIVVSQLPPLLALPRPPSQSALGMLLNVFDGAGGLNPYVLATGLLTIGAMVLARRISPRIPAALLGVAMASVWVYAAGWAARGVTLVASVVGEAPLRMAVHLPQIPQEHALSILPGAGALALLTMVESLSIAKAIGVVSHTRADASRELAAQGAACLVGGLFRCIPVSSSPSRTAVLHENGARTHFAAAFASLVSLAVLAAAPRMLGLIPMAALAGVVVVSAGGLFDWHHIRLTWGTRGISRLVMATTFVMTLILPIHTAVYVGFALSILIFLYESGAPHMSYLKANGAGEFVERDFDALLTEQPPVAIVDIAGPVHFAAVDRLEQRLEQLLHARTRVVILRLRGMQLLASTGVSALESLVETARDQGVTVLLCGVTGQTRDILLSSGLEATVGTAQIFPASPVIFESP